MRPEQWRKLLIWCYIILRKEYMGNSTANPSLPSKDEVIETIIDIFVRVVGFIERKEVSATTNLDKDFYIHTDDLTIFLLEIEKHFGFKPSPKEWLPVDGTIEAIADFVLEQLTKKQRVSGD